MASFDDHGAGAAAKLLKCIHTTPAQLPHELVHLAVGIISVLCIGAFHSAAILLLPSEPKGEKECAEASQ